MRALLLATALALALSTARASATSVGTPAGCAENITAAVEMIGTSAEDIAKAVATCALHGHTAQCVADISKVASDFATAAQDVSLAVTACAGAGSACASDLLGLASDLAGASKDVSEAVAQCGEKNATLECVMDVLNVAEEVDKMVEGVEAAVKSCKAHNATSTKLAASSRLLQEQMQRARAAWPAVGDSVKRAARGMTAQRIREKKVLAPEPVVIRKSDGQRIGGGPATTGRTLQQKATVVDDEPVKGGDIEAEAPECSSGTVFCNARGKCVNDDGKSCPGATARRMKAQRIREKKVLAPEPVVIRKSDGQRIGGGPATTGRSLQQNEKPTLIDDEEPLTRQDVDGEAPECSPGTAWCKKHRRCSNVGEC